MTHWWERINREAEREALRDLIPQGGCLVVEGDEQSGRPQAAALMEEALNEFGYRTIRADLGAGRPVSVRALLRDIWKKLAPAPAPEQVPPWVQHVGSLTTGFIASELRQLAREDERLALVLVDPDLVEPLTAHEVAVISELAADRRWIIVITSNRESKSPWHTLGPLHRSLVLRDFSYDDVRVCLVNAPELAETSVAELEAAAQAVVAAASGPIRPGVAYTVLKAWSERER